jgi:hypothetical protein
MAKSRSSSSKAASSKAASSKAASKAAAKAAKAAAAAEAEAQATQAVAALAAMAAKARTTPRSSITTPIDIVYVGPTLPAHLARNGLPGAQIRGPVAVGDVLRVVDDHVAGRERVGRIAIIDGYFERMAAVWHKEILLALEAGIEVWGAASMGALRAAELAPFGMRGVGAIYERFATGELVCDDEVAVAHLPAEFEYKPTSVALVDIRDALAEAKIPDADRVTLVELARARFYRERTWENLLADAAAAGVPNKTMDKAVYKFSANAKAHDARLLLGEMKRAQPMKTKKITVPRTWALAQLRATLDRSRS